jgi:branched-chain amino acid transport system ATP-binding protein
VSRRRNLNFARDSGAADDALLVVDDIAVHFGGIVALAGVSLSARAGEVLGIIGPNGAGKTTLFDVVAGVRAPSRGRVALDGDDLTRRTPSARARLGLRRTFQRVQTFGWLSVEDNVLAALEWRSGGGGVFADLVHLPTRTSRERDRRAHVAKVLARCGLMPVRHELAGSLPTGTARMVELARAVADEPRLLLLDEPASGLDELEVERLGACIEHARDEIGCAVLLIEHDAAFVMRHCDRVVVLDRGAVLAIGSPEEIQANQAVRDAYLGALASPEPHP